MQQFAAVLTVATLTFVPSLSPELVCPDHAAPRGGVCPAASGPFAVGGGSGTGGGGGGDGGLLGAIGRAIGGILG